MTMMRVCGRMRLLVGLIRSIRGFAAVQCGEAVFHRDSILMICGYAAVTKRRSR